MKNFLITESEKTKILGMHYKAMGKTLVNEQDETDLLWHTYVTAASEKIKPGARKMESGPNFLSDDKINKYKTYDVDFTVNGPGGDKRVFYQCIDSEPNTVPFYKAGQIFDENGKLTNTAAELDAGGVPWRPLISVACKPAMTVLAARKAKQQPQAQVAGATTSNSAEKQKQIDAALKAGKMTKKVDATTGKTTYYSTGKGAFNIGFFNINAKNGEDITKSVMD
jgi:hypothetical protein